METFWNDIQYALRQLRKSPAYTLTAVLTLALGIGVATTVASLVRQVLLAPLPYAEPNRLVGIAFSWPASTSAEQTGATADFITRNATSFSSLTTLDDSSSTANLSEDGRASSIHVLGVSQPFFQTLGTTPFLGRLFTTAEDHPGAPTPLVLSYGLWQRAFGGDRSIIGRALRINQQSITVVGVLPSTFRFEAYSSRSTMTSVDAFRPLQLSPQTPGYEGDNFEMFGRLRPGVSIEQAQQELSTLQPRLYRELPYLKAWKSSAQKNPDLLVAPMSKVIAGDVHDSLIVMAYATMAVLILTSLNLAGLNIARALRRAPDFALREALGATPARMLRLAVLETAAIALAGITGAVAIVRVLLPFLLERSPIPIPTLNGVAGIWTTAALAAVIGAVSALLFGFPLAAAATRRSRSSLMSSNRSGGVTSSHARAGRTLLTLQISVAILLVSTASVLLGTFLKLRAQPTGFHAQQVVVFQTNLKGDRYASTRSTSRFVDGVLTSLRRSPGVASAAGINGLPLDRGLNISGWPEGRTHLAQTIQFRSITPGYFSTLGMTLLQGRNLSDSDGPLTLRVAVISAAAAKKWWPRSSPIGDVVHIGDVHNQAPGDALHIVGIVADTATNSLYDQAPIIFYTPVAQQEDGMTQSMNNWFPTSFAVRLAAQLDAASIATRAVNAVDPEIPVARLTTMQSIVDNSIATPRFFTQLAEAFAAFGVLLTAIGLFGLLSYQVAQRTREIGVRMALGANRGNILRSVLASSGRLAVLGSALGLAGAFMLRPLLTRWIADTVVGLDPSDHSLLFNGTASIFIACAALLLTTLVSSYLPARRAASVEPLEALRSE